MNTELWQNNSPSRVVGCSYQPHLFLRSCMQHAILYVGTHPYNPVPLSGGNNHFPPVQTNVVVVQQQPTVVVTSTQVRRYGTGDHGLIYAIVASACIFFIGVWCSLVCTVPAIFVSISVSAEYYK